MVRWAPLSTPLHRRLQTASVLLWIFLLPIFTNSYFILFLFPKLFPYLLCYAIWVWLDPAPECAGRTSEWVRGLSYWRWVRDYFPIDLVRTEELTPKRSYIFGYHPHGIHQLVVLMEGIIAIGAFINFGTEASKFSELFPGIKMHLLTLGANFKLPFWRELLLALGLCSVNKRSCENILHRGESCMIVVGGASEAIYAYPGTYNLVLKRRYGFIKLALKNGATLVPVVAFNENDAWDQVANPPGSRILRFQKLVQRMLSFTPILFFGRGVFQYSVGIMPFRKRIVTVVGGALECPLTRNPSAELVKIYHEMYVKRLVELFDAHKDKYALDRKSEITIIE